MRKFAYSFTADKKNKLIYAATCAASMLLGLWMGYLLFGNAAAYVYACENPVYHAQAQTHVSETAYHQPTPPVLYNHEPAAATHRYIVTAKDGFIVVYHAEAYGGGVKEVTTTPVSALAPAEVELLTQGILIYTEEALARILQDYGS